jgi:dienelactone hydrolase
VPQLENTGPWRAAPILVSGTQAYRDGEWLYQDFLFDDHGALGGADPNDPHGPNSNLFSPTDGGVTYPTDPVFAGNAADLVELRVRPLVDATAFRVTLNSLKDPARTAFTIALGSSPTARPWPHGAGVSSPAERFVTVHGAAAELADALTGQAVPGGAGATVDLERRQIDVRVPHSAWNPGTGKVRLTVGVGLWDPKADTYLQPAPGAATATTPGGGLPGGSALFNVGPRFAEPFPSAASPGGNTLVDAAAGAKALGAWWRERAQATALAQHDVSSFAADIDFAKLAAGATDDSAIPGTGPVNRILASRYVTGQGEDPSAVCFDLAANGDALGTGPQEQAPGPRCEGRLRGQLQPYTVYLPRQAPPASGYGLTLLLHSLSANYNQYASSKNQSQLGDRGSGSIVLTPAGRGPDGFYAGIPEADAFEAWADVARHYHLDPSLTDVSGYSMGGFGTFRFLARWPDLFARGFSVVGAPGTVADQLASLRNTPILSWNGDRDELVNAETTRQTIAALEASRARFVEDLFTNTSHLTLATNDEYGPGAAFLGDARVDVNPPHVTFVVDPREDNAAHGVTADHAYWLSGVRVRDAAKAPTATIDVRSEGFRVGDAPVGDPANGAGTLTGGQKGVLAYVERRRDWAPPPAAPKADVLHVKAINVGAVTIDTARARVSCAPTLDLTSDGPIDLRLDCPQVAGASGVGPSCSGRVAVRLPRIRGARIVRVTVTRSGHQVQRVRGKALRTVSIRRVTPGAFGVRLTLRVRGRDGTTRRVVITRRIAACR